MFGLTLATTFITFLIFTNKQKIISPIVVSNKFGSTYYTTSSVLSSPSSFSMSATSSSSSSSSSSSWESVIPIAKEWIEQDPNDTTVLYVQNLIELASLHNNKDAQNELILLFPNNYNERIEFGTAGLRSNMKPGPLNMNDLTVIQTAQGIAKYCYDSECQQDINTVLNVVIGYDHRQSDSKYNVSSLSFAILTAIVFKQSGCFSDVLLLNGLIATPLIPFSVNVMSQNNYYKNDDNNKSGNNNNNNNNDNNDNDNVIINKTIGIMITASHNPKQDAGYKVYWYDGCQIRSPIDIGISESIQQNLQTWCNYKEKLIQLKDKYIINKNHGIDNENSITDDPCYGLSDPVRTQDMINRYYNAIQTSGLITKEPTLSFLMESNDTNDDDNNNNTSRPNKPRFCYTAMHGVGYSFVKHVMEDVLGSVQSSLYVSVPIQEKPDPTFPTVSFPNPEEKGALDLAQQYANENNCNIILANDPDADRLAVAEKGIDDKWTVFTGDQIGVMLGYWLWENIGKKDPTKKYAMCASTASSKMLGEIAKREGFYFEDTLTGFKWIGSRAYELSKKEGYEILFGYEEAIGFCCGNIIYDKDGITALTVIVQLASYLYKHHYTLKSYLQKLYTKYGEFVSNNGYYFLPTSSITIQIFNELIDNGTFTTLLNGTIGPYEIKSFRYLGEPGYDSTKEDNKPTLPTSKSSPMLTINLANHCCIQFRGSGTEPKFKYYIELQGQPGVSRTAVTAELMIISQTVLELLIQPSKWGLILPK